MKRVLIGLLLCSSQAFALEMSLLGYTTQRGTQFFGINMATGHTETIRISQLTPQERQLLQACTSSMETTRAARLVVDFVPRYDSDVRSLDTRTFMPNGYSPPALVVKSVSCAQVGIHFEAHWHATLAKSKSRKK